MLVSWAEHDTTLKGQAMEETCRRIEGFCSSTNAHTEALFKKLVDEHSKLVPSPDPLPILLELGQYNTAVE
jgi:hypothetical protein